MNTTEIQHRLKEAVPPLLDWYARNERPLPWRQSPTPYHVWISEIMLQQTRIEAVIPHYTAFLSAMPDIAPLAEAPEEQLLKCWEGLGFYSRARNLQKTAKLLINSGKADLPSRFDELIQLPGIGEYTAGAIASIAFGEAVPAVDGNVMRVLARLTADDTDVLSQKGKQRFRALAAAMVPPDAPGRFNQAVMELGETICLPSAEPRCAACPLAEMCLGNRQGIADQLPVRKKSKPRRIEQRTVFILHEQGSGRVLLTKRPDTGLLAGLYEFPSAEGALDEIRALQYLSAQGFDVHDIQATAPARHLFSHVEWQMSGFTATVSGCRTNTADVWVTEDALRSQYVLPSAFKAFLPYI